MRWSLILASLIIAALSAHALADDKQDCLGHKDQDQRIKACSAIVARSPNDAAVYDNRGTAYRVNGDLDRAIADYTKAIELKPDYAAAYNSRGLAYASKGDYIQALADVTKAGELTPKTKAGPQPVKTEDRKTKTKKIARAKSSATEDLLDELPSTSWPTWAAK